MAAQQLLREVSALEDKAEALQKKLTEEQQEKETSHAKQLEQLYKRRQELVSGKALPTEEELQGSSGLSPASAAGSKGLPYFWCTVLCNQDTLAESITPRDRQALHYLTHITAASSPSSSSGGATTVELHFGTNPYFTNKVLRRGISVDEATGELQEVSTDIVWKEGKELTLKETKSRKGHASGKKAGGKKGGGGGGKKGGRKGGGADEDDEPADGDASSPAAAAAEVKRKPCPSFFRFFAASGAAAAGGRGRAAELDPTALRGPEEEAEEEGEEDERPALDARVAAKLDSDSQLLQLLLREVLPRAMHLYMSGPLQGASGGSDNEGSEDSYSLVHGSAGTIEDLPPALQAVAAALQHNQEQIDAAGQRRARERLSAMRAVQEEAQGLYAKRRALLLSDDGSSSRIPGFWLHVLRSTESGALAITRRDAAVLSQLADVRCSMVLPKGVDSRGLTEVTVALELEFLPGSPYLSSSAHPTSSSSSGKGGASKPGGSSSSSPITLVKHYTLERGGGLFEGAGWVMRTSKVVNTPHWSNADKDPTHAKPPSSSEGAQHQRKGRTICSLFHLFRPNAGKWVFNITGDDKDAQEEANQLELELLMALQQEALPHAAAAYTAADKDGSTQDGWGDPSAFDVLSEDDDSSGDEEGDGDHEDAAERAARRAQKKAAAGGFKWTKGHMLLVLMLMIILGEVVVFLDTMGWFRAPNPQ